MTDDLCPCCSGNDYAACCAPLHAGAPATRATALMRARFCAYALGNVAYVVNTTLPGGRAHEADDRTWRRQLRTFCETTQFDGLEVTHERQTETDAWVSFVARLRRGGDDASFAEKSHFCRRSRLWLYEGGEPRPIL